MNIKPEYIVAAFKNALSYIHITLLLTLAVVLVGLLFGVMVAALRTYRIPALSHAADAFIIAFKAIPINLILVVSSILFVTHFDRIVGLLHLTVTIRDVNRVYVGLFALSLPVIAHMSEYIRGSLLSVDKGQYEAGYMVGMTFFQTFRRIVFPQMMVVFVPSLTGIVIALMKSTSLVILIGVVDVLNGALKYANLYFSYFEAYLAAALVYWGLSLIIEWLGKALEKSIGKYRGDAS
ncbi:amino acid ABC transporter permease [Paenibacillus cymbidii]|uniref:amino acid ABC transporter permease n=1 Tax=Paenibacillus cymbidii TaxID=1639034 RepID=UPI0010817890|nr:ABC transporter permease subunit [Paenibacillus cymbidii]